VPDTDIVSNLSLNAQMRSQRGTISAAQAQHKERKNRDELDFKASHSNAFIGRVELISDDTKNSHGAALMGRPTQK